MLKTNTLQESISITVLMKHYSRQQGNYFVPSNLQMASAEYLISIDLIELTEQNASELWVMDSFANQIRVHNDPKPTISVFKHDDRFNLIPNQDEIYPNSPAFSICVGYSLKNFNGCANEILWLDGNHRTVALFRARNNPIYSKGSLIVYTIIPPDLTGASRYDATLFGGDDRTTFLKQYLGSYGL